MQCSAGAKGGRAKLEKQLQINARGNFQLSAYDHLRNDGWCSAPLSEVSGVTARDAADLLIALNPRGLPMTTLTLTGERTEGMTADERQVIFASSLGTVFE